MLIPILAAYIVGKLVDEEDGKIINKCTLHSWSASILDGKLYCMTCNKMSEVSNAEDI